MSYIEREALRDALCEADAITMKGIAIINQFPAADVAPVVHGEWLNFNGDFSAAECDQCGELYEVSPDEKPCEDYFNAFKQFYKFCPNCGAKMDGGEKREME